MATDYYALLGVTSQASDDDIKRAYRRMARELHPDSTGGDSEAETRFKEVTRAYEVLRDPQRRARYDQFGPDGVDGTVPGAGDLFGGGLGDLFDAFFSGSGGGPRRRGGPVRGDDTEIVLELAFREAVFGASRRADAGHSGGLHDVSGDRGPGRHHRHAMPRMPGRGRVASGAPIDSGPGGDGHAVPSLWWQR